MAEAGMWDNSKLGCPQTEDKCTTNDLSGPDYCVHGECVATYDSRKCICDPGWFGDRCDKGETDARKKFRKGN